MPAIVVLSVSTDPPLLKTRSLLLRNAGYTVVEQLSVKAAASDFLSGDFDAVLLCHSIAEEQRAGLIGLVRGRSPSTRIVLISDRLGESDPRVDATAESDPEALLENLATLLRRRPGSFGAMRKQA